MLGYARGANPRHEDSIAPKTVRLFNLNLALSGFLCVSVSLW